MLPLLTSLALASPPAVTDPMSVVPLAWFVDSATGKCRWQGGEIDDTGTIAPTSAIATFPHACPNSPWVAVRPDGDAALVVIGHASWLVTLPEGRATPLPVVSGVAHAYLGFDQTGTVMAHGLEVDVLMDATARRSVEGAAGIDDIPGLRRDVAVQKSFKGGRWETDRRVLTSSGYCGAAGVNVLGPLHRYATWGAAQPEWSPAGSQVAAALEPFRPPEGDLRGEWRIARWAGGAVAQWFEMGDADYSERPVLIERANAWERIDPALDALDPPMRDIVTAMIGRYVLLSSGGLTNALVDAQDGSVHAVPAGALSITADPRGTAHRPANPEARGPRL